MLFGKGAAGSRSRAFSIATVPRSGSPVSVAQSNPAARPRRSSRIWCTPLCGTDPAPRFHLASDRLGAAAGHFMLDSRFTNAALLV
jgi:hypothetical protein